MSSSHTSALLIRCVQCRNNISEFVKIDSKLCVREKEKERKNKREKERKNISYHSTSESVQAISVIVSNHMKLIIFFSQNINIPHTRKLCIYL